MNVHSAYLTTPTTVVTASMYRRDGRWGRRAIAVAIGAIAAWMVTSALFGTHANAAPAAPTVFTLRQPNGVTFSAHLWGDEWNNGTETTDGYTIAKDPGSGYWTYAEPARSGRLRSGDLRVGIDDPAGLPQHLRPTTLTPVLSGSAGHGKSVPNTGTQRTLVILVRFLDQASSTTAASWNSLYFGASNSVADYYNKASYGALNIGPASETSGTANDGVVGWLDLNRNHPNSGCCTSYPNLQLTKDAIVAADPFVNYASYDANGDGAIGRRELHISVIPAGCEYSYGSVPAGCKSVWGHNATIDAGNGSIVPPVADGVKVGGSAGGGGYLQFGEMHNTHQATIGIMVHELGHDLALPDLYDTNPGGNSTDAEGVGVWSVMGGGSWSFVAGQFQGATPTLLDAWSKTYEGWLTPTRVSGTLLSQSIANVENNATAYQLLDNPRGVDWTFQQTSGTGEYFLVENRQKTGYDASLPGCGLLIWHIDETRTSSNSANADETRKLVDLEEADGLANLDNKVNRGDAGDPFPGSTNKFGFNDATNPNSKLYSGAASGVSVALGPSGCGPNMTATLTAPVTDLTPPSLSVTHTPDGTNGWNKTSPVTVSIAASDAGSGLDGQPACTDNGKSLIVIETFGSFYTLVSGNGTHAIACSVFDKAGTLAKQNDSIKLDATAPSVTLLDPGGTLNGWFTTKPVQVTAIVGDTGTSGLIGAPVCTDNGAPIAVSGSAPNYTLSVTNEGNNAIVCRATDSAGNIGQATKQIPIDTLAPTAQIEAPKTITSPFVVTFSEPVYSVGTQTLTFTAAGAATPLAGTLTCKDPNGAVANCSGPVLTATFDPTPNLIAGQTYVVALSPGWPPAGLYDVVLRVGTGSYPVRAAMTVDNDDPGLTYTWPKQSAAQAAGGTYLREQWGGATLAYTFKGTAVTWKTVKGPDQGTAKVTISNSSVNGATVNNYQATTAFGAGVTFSGLPSGKHTLKITVNGAKGDPAGTGTWVSVDAFTVGLTTAANPKVTTTWTDGGGFGYRWSAGLNGTVTLKFRGTGISWNALYGPNNGKAKLSIDGTPQTIDLYDTGYYYADVSVTGLSNTTLHTLKITVLGQKNAASSDTIVSVNRFSIE